MAARRFSPDKNAMPSLVLQDLTRQALDVAKKGRRHRKSLSGDNYYGNRFAELKSLATEAFEQLLTPSTGDTSALAELLDSIFDPKAEATDRLSAQRELTSALRRLSRVTPASAQAPRRFP
jgi:hypothetical protein